MKKYQFIIILFTTSCSDSKWNGEWGATVGDCDEICTIYYSAQQEVMKYDELNEFEFPSEEEQRIHVKPSENGHSIESWFRIIKDTDTSINEFSCEVLYDEATIRYVVKNLKIKELNLISSSSEKLESDTVKIVLEYYGWGCPCLQWITSENRAIYESSKNEQKDKQLHFFLNVKPANDTLPNPFELTSDMGNLRFEFTGQFYVDPQFLGDEGEQGPAKTLLYHSVKHLK